MRLLKTLILSVGVHGLIGWCLSLIQPVAELPEAAIDHFVEFVENPKPRSDELKTFTRKQDLPDELLRENDPKAKRRFMSEKEQTVLEEMRAAESGLTENRSETMNSKKRSLGSFAPKFSQSAPAGGTSDPGFEEGIDVGSREEGQGREDEKGRELDYPPMARFGLDAGRSTFGEMAPNDIKVGQMTALNTDRFLYYSFYARAQEQVYHHWAKYVRAVLYSYQHSGAATGDEFWITRIEIILDKDGRFVKGLMHQGSGLQGLDLAPVHAFRDAKQIPHPPPEMVSEDGLVHMDWEFAVQMIPQLASGR